MENTYRMWNEKGENLGTVRCSKALLVEIVDKVDEIDDTSLVEQKELFEVLKERLEGIPRRMIFEEAQERMKEGYNTFDERERLDEEIIEQLRGMDSGEILERAYEKYKVNCEEEDKKPLKYSVWKEVREAKFEGGLIEQLLETTYLVYASHDPAEYYITMGAIEKLEAKAMALKQKYGEEGFKDMEASVEEEEMNKLIAEKVKPYIEA